MNKRALPVSAIVLLGLSAVATAEPLLQIPADVLRIIRNEWRAYRKAAA